MSAGVPNQRQRLLEGRITQLEGEVEAIRGEKAFLVEHLRRQTDRIDAIVAILELYDAPRADITRDETLVRNGS